MAESKRREEGRGLDESKKSLKDLRRQTWISERKRAKEEEKAAREAVSVYIRSQNFHSRSQNFVFTSYVHGASRVVA